MEKRYSGKNTWSHVFRPTTFLPIAIIVAVIFFLHYSQRTRTLSRKNKSAPPQRQNKGQPFYPQDNIVPKINTLLPLSSLEGAVSTSHKIRISQRPLAVIIPLRTENDVTRGAAVLRHLRQYTYQRIITTVLGGAGRFAGFSIFSGRGLSAYGYTIMNDNAFARTEKRRRYYSYRPSFWRNTAILSHYLFLTGHLQTEWTHNFILIGDTTTTDREQWLERYLQPRNLLLFAISKDQHRRSVMIHLRTLLRNHGRPVRYKKQTIFYLPKEGP